MYDEYNHLLVLAKKYNISSLLIGTFWGLSFSFISMIKFEMFLKDYVACKTTQDKREQITYYMYQRLKRILEERESYDTTCYFN